MANVIQIDDIDYPGYTNEEPDVYTKIEDIKDIDYYYKIEPNDYELIERSRTIYYTIDDTKGYCSSGCVIKYIKPDTFILKNTKLLMIWSIHVDDMDIYVKDTKKVREENMQKENLWKLYKEGFVKILID